MNDVLRTALGFFASVAPFGALPVFLAYIRVAYSEPPHSVYWLNALRATMTALVLLAVAALAADPFLDWLDVSPQSFQFAAGAVMAPLAARLLLTGTSMPVPRPGEKAPRLLWLIPLAAPLLAGPVSLVASISYSARFGEPEAIAVAVAVLALTACLLAVGPTIDRMGGPLLMDTLGRLSGALLAIVAVGLAIDGVRSV